MTHQTGTRTPDCPARVAPRRLRRGPPLRPLAKGALGERLDPDSFTVASEKQWRLRLGAAVGARTGGLGRGCGVPTRQGPSCLPQVAVAVTDRRMVQVLGPQRQRGRRRRAQVSQGGGAKGLESCSGSALVRAARALVHGAGKGVRGEAPHDCLRYGTAPFAPGLSRLRGRTAEFGDGVARPRAWQTERPVGGQGAVPTGHVMSGA